MLHVVERVRRTRDFSISYIALAFTPFCPTDFFIKVKPKTYFMHRQKPFAN